jgi:hypothetical protein
MAATETHRRPARGDVIGVAVIDLGPERERAYRRPARIRKSSVVMDGRAVLRLDAGLG